MYRQDDALRYARLITGKLGLNVQPGQTMVLRASTENAEFARMVAEAAFEAGAGDVVTLYADQRTERIRLSRAAEEKLANVKMWYYDAMEGYLREGCCYLNIISSDPDAFSGIDAGRVGTYTKASMHALRGFYTELDKNLNQWLVAAAPGEG